MLAKQGKSVLIWDMDPQGGSSYFFNVQNNNCNKYARLFDKYLTIYDVIQSTDTNQIDIISNDHVFSDQFLNKASRVTALNFINNDLIKLTLDEVADDYDYCIMDCSPGRFLLHDNIFKTCDLLLVPNVPAPLSVYCNNLLLQELKLKTTSFKQVLSFYNMVQPQKVLHKFYLENRTNDDSCILENYIPFYAEIEAITLNKESIFHQIKGYKTNVFYENIWIEVCAKMGWPNSVINKVTVVDFNENLPKYNQATFQAIELKLPIAANA